MENAEILLRLPQVEMMIGLKRSSIYTRIAAGQFPKPVNLGARAVAFRRSEVQAWIAGRVNASGGVA
jgi:prophage regulatory protein